MGRGALTGRGHRYSWRGKIVVIDQRRIKTRRMPSMDGLCLSIEIPLILSDISKSRKTRGMDARLVPKPTTNSCPTGVTRWTNTPPSPRSSPTGSAVATLCTYMYICIVYVCIVPLAIRTPVASRQHPTMSFPRLACFVPTIGGTTAHCMHGIGFLQNADTQPNYVHT